ncbi:MAG: hypothetical protein BroJett040_09720 [Oligoflexia bacterium]|nr:MAG: hypothetical protein BroJett040_09720 [Oligoflexia bacterium]
MIRSLVLVLGLIAGTAASATTINNVMFDVAQNIMSEADMAGFNFKVGDTASYNLDMGFIKGSMKMTVKEVAADQVVISQDMDLGFAGKQACDMTLNPNTGEMKKMVCNGQEQNPGDKGDIELVESKEDTITVPAGTFTCLYIKALEKTKNQTIEQWANPKQVPVFGMIKTIAPSQFGKITIALTSYKRM